MRALCGNIVIIFSTLRSSQILSPMKAEFAKAEAGMQQWHHSILWLEFPLSSTFYMKENLS